MGREIRSGLSPSLLHFWLDNLGKDDKVPKARSAGGWNVRTEEQSEEWLLNPHPFHTTRNWSFSGPTSPPKHSPWQMSTFPKSALSQRDLLNTQAGSIKKTVSSLYTQGLLDQSLGLRPRTPSLNTSRAGKGYPRLPGKLPGCLSSSRPGTCRRGRAASLLSAFNWACFYDSPPRLPATGNSK